MAMRITVHSDIVELCSLRCRALVFWRICMPTNNSDRITPTEPMTCDKLDHCSSDIAWSSVKEWKRIGDVAHVWIDGIDALPTTPQLTFAIEGIPVAEALALIADAAGMLVRQRDEARFAFVARPAAAGPAAQAR